MKIPFAKSARSSLGVEWELALVDKDTGDLRQVAETILDALAPSPGEEHPNIKQELLLNTVELVTDVCGSVAEATADLAKNMQLVREIADPLRVELMCAGTHPFARWTHQRVTDREHYNTLIDRTQWWGRQMLIYGVHVHVGIEDREKVLPIGRAIMTHYGHFQALTASSPFWGGVDTGYASNRALMFQQLPTAGLPFGFERWDEYERYVADMLKTGVIDSLKSIHWDIRPSPQFGTLELRICDGLPTIREVGAIAALSQSLVEFYSREIDAGRQTPSLPAWFAQENKWRSARYGMEAILILDADGNEELVTTDLLRLVETLIPIADDLGCAEELSVIPDLVAGGASYQRQRKVAAQADGAMDQVVASLVAEMRAGRPLFT